MITATTLKGFLNLHLYSARFFTSHLLLPERFTETFLFVLFYKQMEQYRAFGTAFALVSKGKLGKIIFY